MDFFALLGLPTRPWVDAEALRQRHLALTSQHHPDRLPQGSSTASTAAAVDRTASLNQAAAVLGSHRDRLGYLHELVSGQPPSSTASIPGDLVELFAQMSEVLRATDDFLAARARMTSPILKAQAYGKGLDWMGRLQELQDQVRQRMAEFEEALREFDADWDGLDTADRARGLRAAQFRASCLQKWTDQLSDRIVQLGF